MKKSDFEIIARDNGLSLINLAALMIVKSAIRWNDKYDACAPLGTLKLLHWQEHPSFSMALQDLASKGFVRYEGYYNYRVMKKGWNQIPYDLGMHIYFQGFNIQNVIFKTISYKDQCVDLEELEKFSEKT